MNKMLRLPVALAFALGASNAFALGLGQVQVKSSLNQPLLAEIPVLENAPGEAADLQIRLASSEAFARIGLERPSAALLTSLSFEIVQGAAGKPVIRITTPNRVNDPFVSLLIEAEWARGKLLREYTLLLDPPVAVPSRATPSETQALPQGDVRPAPSESLSTPPPMATPRAAAPTAAPSFAPGESYGPVNSGDSLWKIASQSIPDSSVNINQMMVAIQRANPDAFIGGNINRLRTGAVLRIPSRDEISAVGAREASQFVREQTSGDTPLQPVEADRSAARPASTSTSAASADSRLAIVPPRGDQPATAAQSGAASGAEGRELRADLARAREQGEALSQENRELKSRVQELEKIRGDSERLLELRNSELQALQQRLAELEAQRAATAATEAAASSAPAAAPTVEAPAAAPSSSLPPLDPVEESAASSAAPADAGADLSDSSEAAAEPADADATVSEPAASAPASPTPAPAQAEPAAPPAADTLPPRPPRQEWYENPLVLGGGGALLIGLLALLGLRGRGRKKAAAAGAVASSRFEGTDFGVPAASAEAEHDAAAYEDAEERELLDRVAEQPDDLERHIDLVRYYYGINDPARFEGAVEAMYAQVYDPDDAHWQQALQMGREILPDHPLFMDLPAQDAAVGGWEPAAEPQVPAHDTGAYRADAALPPQPGTAQRIDDEPEFRIDLAEPEFVVPEVERTVAAEAPAYAPAPEFSRSDAAATASDAGLSADAIEAAATKLELARAYLDMGDVEGARGMLEEVTQEGTSEQRQDARRLLDEIR